MKNIDEFIEETLKEDYHIMMNQLDCSIYQFAKTRFIQLSILKELRALNKKFEMEDDND